MTMAFQILLNFLIAIVWMFLSSSMTAKAFVIGYLIGIILIVTMRRFFNERLYVERLWAAIKLVLIFFRELTLSNISVLRVVLRPKMNIQPMIFAMPIELKEDWEITLLSSLITLTPGTLVINVSDDKKTLYIHAIDVEDVDEVIDSINNSFQKAIKEVSRA